MVWHWWELELGAVDVVAAAAAWEVRGRLGTKVSAEGRGVWQMWEAVGALETEN